MVSRFQRCCPIISVSMHYLRQSKSMISLLVEARKAFISSRRLFTPHLHMLLCYTLTWPNFYSTGGSLSLKLISGCHSYCRNIFQSFLELVEASHDEQRKQIQCSKFSSKIYLQMPTARSCGKEFNRKQFLSFQIYSHF